MTEKEQFLKAIEENENDHLPRLIFADWLDEHGEHEEADRQRKYPAAKEWLEKFAAAGNRWTASNGEVFKEDEYPIDYAELMRLANEAATDEDCPWEISTGNNNTMCDALRDNREEFWRNWSIVTGIPLPPDLDDLTAFHCAC